ncbi:uncharacterized protein LOC129271865 [Lytechinus pictus]|uniref:uncharacterized protein LOC129271865 n=1 Tax=Lytechinus pictus TaxID=7653 RepID=UPI0030BA1DF8
MQEDERSRMSLSDMQSEAKATTAGRGKGKNGDIKKLVRSEVKRIMEAQHQSMMSMLDTAGTLILNNLEQTTDGQHHACTNGSMSSNGNEGHQNKTDQDLPDQAEQQSIAGPSYVTETKKSHSVGEDSSRDKGSRTPDGEVQVETFADSAAQASKGTNGVPPLKLEDLASSREPSYHHKGRPPMSARSIPGMMTGFPLLTIPKDDGRGEQGAVGMVGGSEYDLIPTRERDSARGPSHDRKDIVLLKVLPERTVASSPPRRGRVEPPQYKQSFTFDNRTPRGPPNYALQGIPQKVISGMPLLRIPPETDYKFPVPQHSNVPYSQMNQPKMMHQGDQTHAPPYAIGHHGPPGHTPREAWGNRPAEGAYSVYPLQGKIDIPLLRIDSAKPTMAAPQSMQHAPVRSQVPSKPSQTERTRINLPLLHLKNPEPQHLLQANFKRPLQPKLPIVSPEEILAYQQEKRRQELAREEEFRKQNGGQMQLLHLEPEQTTDVLATTSRQRRRERLESKENDSRMDLEPGQKNAKIRKSNTQPKHFQKGRKSSKVNDMILKEVSSDEEEVMERVPPIPSPRGRVVMVIPKEDETEPSRQKEAEEKVMQVGSNNKMETDVKERPKLTTHDVETQVSAVGAGYAIKPGTYDEALSDPDARPLLPTSAQIHYETVMKLQQPPPVVTTREAETQVKDVRETGTSTEGRESLDIIQERLARRRTDRSQEAKPTIEEVEEQYTQVATGLNKAGNIIAPDIFFGLRFRSGEEQTSSATGPDTGQPGSSGRDFIHVADINADDVFRDIPQHPDSKDFKGRRRREDDDYQYPEKDGSTRRSSGEKGSKRRREDDGTEEEDQATIAELHYNSLFHRDAVPADGLALLEDDGDGMDGAERRKRIGDEVTRKLLEAKLDKAERGMKLASEISSSRNQSKNRIQNQLANMNERLGAIDEVSQSMQRDFNNTKLLLHTVENLSEAMAQQLGDARPRPDYSLKDYKQPKTVVESPKTPPLSTDDLPIDVDAEKEEERKKDEETKEDEKKDVKFEVEKLEEDGEVDEEEDDHGDIERTLVTEGNLTLGISGISGVSDIIAEVIAGDDVDADEFGLTEQQKRAAKKRVQTRHDSFTEEDLVDIPLTSLTDRQLRQIFSPRSASSPEERTKPWPFAAKPEGRSAEERQKIKEWMERRRVQQIEDYKKKRGEKSEREHRPFRPKGDSLKQIPTSTIEIKRAEVEKKTKRQIKSHDHHEDRIAQAKDLMAEIFEDTPNLPLRPLIEPPCKDRSDKLRKQATSVRGTATPTARQPSSRAAATPQPSTRTVATPQPRAGADSRMSGTRVLGDRSNVAKNDGRGQQGGRTLPKGTYMFIDSEAYQGPARERNRHDDYDHHQERDQTENRQHEHPAFRGSTDRRPPRRSFQASMERSVQFADPRRSSDEDLQLVLAEMSDLVTPRSEDSDHASSHHELESAAGTYYKPKSFTEVVRVQRPEVTRKREGTPRKPKTYTDMLQEMKAEVSSSRAPSSVKSKQRLYGTTRLPGWNKNRKQYTKTPKTYTERLAEMRGAQGTGGQATRLVQRPKPKPRQQERPGTATMTIGPNRRQQVERRGITPEPGPRSSTPYTAMLAQLSNSGTLRGREPVVSPRINPGMKAKPRAHEPVPYVDRLKQSAAEASPTTKHKSVYGTRPVPTGTYYTRKAAPLRSPSPRHQPYEMGTRQAGRGEEEMSDVSALSPWSVSDDVRRLLEEDDDFDEGLPTITEPQYEMSDLGEQDYDGDYAASVDVRELEEIASIGSGSIMSNIDWDAIDEMIQTVK